MHQVIISGLEVNAFFENLRAIIRHEVNQQPQLPAFVAPTEDKLLTIKEAAELLDICTASVHELKRKGILPFYRLGGRSYLKQKEILAALQGQQRTVKTTQSGQ